MKKSKKKTEQQSSAPEDNVALYVLKALHDEGISHIFLVPGAMIDPFLSKYAKAGIVPIVACQEGGAAYMADGYARASQNFGVAMGIGGPGVTNMMTAISAAYSDRSPVLVVAGNIPFDWEGKGTFQDSSTTGVDDRDIMLPTTVFADVIPDTDLLETFIRKSIKAMKGVENRPAFISVPRDMQEDEWKASYTPVRAVESPRILDAERVGIVPELLDGATRISILVGNGAVWSQASEEIQAFAEEYSIPIVTSLRAKGAVSEDSKMSMGVYGLGGSLWANKVIMGAKKSDINPKLPRSEVLLVLGATLNENNTHGWAPMFKPSKSLICVDINPNNVLGKEYDEEFIMGDVRTFMRWMRDHRELYHKNLLASKGKREKWLATIRQTPYYDTDAERISNAIPINPARAIADLRKVAPRDAVMIVDSGAHTYFTGHNWTSYAPNEFLFLSTTGPMGYGVAMTIGAKMARPHQPHVAVVGDGSLLMHGMEIHSAVRFKVPMVIVVINNSALGNVYLRARDEGPEATYLSEIFPTQNWAEFCIALGGDGIVVEDPTDLEAAFEKAFQTQDKPFLVDVRCDKNIDTPNTQEYANW